MTESKLTSEESEDARALRHMLERQRVSDLLLEFAHRLDTKNWAELPDLFVEGGVLELRYLDRVITMSRADLDKLRQTGTRLRRYRLTQHFSTNHRIELDGDRATSRSYMLAIHMFEEPAKHADVGGYYDCEMERMSEGWRFRHVTMNESWTANEEILQE